MATHTKISGRTLKLAPDLQISITPGLPPQARQREGRHVCPGAHLRPQEPGELHLCRRER